MHVPGQQYLLFISINYKLVNRLLCVMNQPIDSNGLRSNPPHLMCHSHLHSVGSCGTQRLVINGSLPNTCHFHVRVKGVRVVVDNINPSITRDTE